MTAKREIYARLGVQLRSNRRAFKAERIAPGAMGLYAFMVMDARAELPEIDGFVAEEAVLAAWGRPADERLAQVEALCSVDLVERADGGFVVVKYDEHNDCRVTVEKNKEAARVRMNKHRTNTERTANERVGSVDVPISCSSSLSESDLGSQIASADGAPPAWWESVLDVIEANVDPVRLPAMEAWLRYDGHRAGKGLAPSQKDAQYWLTTVMVAERRKARDEAHHREKRDRDFDAKRRFAKDGPEKPPAPTRAQSQAMAEELAARVRASREKRTAGGGT